MDLSRFFEQKLGSTYGTSQVRSKPHIRLSYIFYQPENLSQNTVFSYGDRPYYRAVQFLAELKKMTNNGTDGIQRIYVLYYIASSKTTCRFSKWRSNSCLRHSPVPQSPHLSEEALRT